MSGIRVFSSKNAGTGRAMALAAVANLVATLALFVAPGEPAAAAPKPSPSCVDTQPDAAAALKMAVACQRPIEILAERTEHSQTFQNADGSRTLEQNIEPVRARKGDSWVPIDTRLKATADGVTARATVLPVVFSGGGDAPMATLRHGSRELGITWPGTLPKPVVKGDTAIYRDVLPGVDLRVTAQALGFSHVLVVRTREAAAHPKLASLRFGLSTKGVTVAATRQGGLAARDGKGETVFSAPAPLMWDSSVGQAQAPPSSGAPGAAPGRAKDSGLPAVPRKKPAREAAPATAAVSVPDGARRAVMPVRVSGGQLTITPDRALLADPGVKYPVFIDPAWTGSISGNATSGPTWPTTAWGGSRRCGCPGG